MKGGSESERDKHAGTMHSRWLLRLYPLISGQGHRFSKHTSIPPHDSLNHRMRQKISGTLYLHSDGFSGKHYETQGLGYSPMPRKLNHFGMCGKSLVNWLIQDAGYISLCWKWTNFLSMFGSSCHIWHAQGSSIRLCGLWRVEFSADSPGELSQLSSQKGGSLSKHWVDL